MNNLFKFSYTVLTSNIRSRSCTATLSDVDIKPSSIECSSSNTIETGRVEKGNYSNQKFETTNVDFEYYPFNHETIYILPESRKVYTSETINKRYCPYCGKKLSPKFKFCPNCGKEVE